MGITDRAIILLIFSVVVFMMVATVMKLSDPTVKAPGAVEQMAKVDPPFQVPAYTVKDGTGATAPLAARFGKPLLLEFFSDECIPCERQMPTLAKVEADAAKAGITVLRVSEAKSGAAAARAFLDSHGAAGAPFIDDAERSLAKALLIKGIPTTLVIDAQGRVVARVEGEADWSTPNSIAAAIAHAAPPPPAAPVK